MAQINRVPAGKSNTGVIIASIVGGLALLVGGGFAIKYFMDKGKEGGVSERGGDGGNGNGAGTGGVSAKTPEQIEKEKQDAIKATEGRGGGNGGVSVKTLEQLEKEKKDAIKAPQGRGADGLAYDFA